jgi:hypothetical protein
LSSFLPFFIPHIPTSTQAHLKLALNQFLPPLLEKLNDPKEKIATPARLSIGLLGKKCFEAEAGQIKDVSIKGKEKESLVGFWERNVKDNALIGKGWRGKVEGMKLILGLKGEVGAKMTLKPWLATLVELLEDGDSNVRETAREVSFRIWRMRLMIDLGRATISVNDTCRSKDGTQETAICQTDTCFHSGQYHYKSLCSFDSNHTSIRSTAIIG